jgi:hypothetical protein
MKPVEHLTIHERFRAHYARMFCTFHPLLGDLFRFRELRSV